MLKWAAVLFVFVLITAVLGFITLSGLLAEVVKFLFFVFTILFAAAVLSGLVSHPVEDPTASGTN